MWNQWFSSDFSGFEISLLQLGHLAMGTSQVVLYLKIKEKQPLEHMLAQNDTTT
jgi:hypothetical protein